MTRWELSEPTTIDLDEVREVRVRLVGGNVDVTGTDGASRLELTKIKGQPLEVDLHNGVLTVSYDDLSWKSILSWNFNRDRAAWLSLAVPPACVVELGVVSASALVSGMTGPTRVRSVSGEVTLDGLSSRVHAQTVSGNVNTQALDGSLEFETVSGELTVAGGTCDSVRATSVSGEIALDVDSPDIRAQSVSGDVLVRLPAGTGVTVDVSSVSGRIDTGFEGLAADASKPGQRRLEGTIGDGTGRLRVRTVSGGVAVLSR